MMLTMLMRGADADDACAMTVMMHVCGAWQMGPIAPVVELLKKTEVSPRVRSLILKAVYVLGKEGDHVLALLSHAGAVKTMALQLAVRYNKQLSVDADDLNYVRVLTQICEVDNKRYQDVILIGGTQVLGTPTVSLRSALPHRARAPKPMPPACASNLLPLITPLTFCLALDFMFPTLRRASRPPRSLLTPTSSVCCKFFGHTWWRMRRYWQMKSRCSGGACASSTACCVSPCYVCRHSRQAQHRYNHTPPPPPPPIEPLLLQTLLLQRLVLVLGSLR